MYVLGDDSLARWRANLFVGLTHLAVVGDYFLAAISDGRQPGQIERPAVRDESPQKEHRHQRGHGEDGADDGGRRGTNVACLITKIRLQMAFK